MENFMSAAKEKMMSIIQTLPDDKGENELVEEFLTRLMLERSKAQFERGEYLEHDVVKSKLLNG